MTVMVDKDDPKDLEQSLSEVLTEPYVRDFMAVERTIMANERTFLSYVRSALGLILGGVSFIHFFDNLAIQIVGWIFLPTGIITFVLGLLRFNKVNRMIEKAETVCLTTAKSE